MLRFLVSFLMVIIVLWFAVTVPIGNHTLFGHFMRIANTREAKDLKDGAKSAAKDAATRVKREMNEAVPKDSPTPAAK